jgi:hypothetical protein
MKTDPTDTAFPTETLDYQYGLTKREYFAGIALQGVLADSKREYEDDALKEPCDLAVAYADALIAALNEKG